VDPTFVASYERERLASAPAAIAAVSLPSQRFFVEVFQRSDEDWIGFEAGPNLTVGPPWMTHPERGQHRLSRGTSRQQMPTDRPLFTKWDIRTKKNSCLQQRFEDDDSRHGRTRGSAKIYFAQQNRSTGVTFIPAWRAGGA